MTFDEWDERVYPDLRTKRDGGRSVRRSAYNAGKLEGREEIKQHIILSMSVRSEIVIHHMLDWIGNIKDAAIDKTMDIVRRVKKEEEGERERDQEPDPSPSDWPDFSC